MYEYLGAISGATIGHIIAGHRGRQSGWGIGKRLGKRRG